MKKLLIGLALIIFACNGPAEQIIGKKGDPINNPFSPKLELHKIRGCDYIVALPHNYAVISIIHAEDCNNSIHKTNKNKKK